MTKPQRDIIGAAAGGTLGAGAGMGSAAVAISGAGSITGLSGAGITTGLKAVGGTMLGGMAVTSGGIAVLAIVGVFGGLAIMKKFNSTN